MATHAHTTMTGCRILIGLAVIGILIGLAALESWADDGVHEPIDLLRQKATHSSVFIDTSLVFVNIDMSVEESVA